MWAFAASRTAQAGRKRAWLGCGQLAAGLARGFLVQTVRMPKVVLHCHSAIPIGVVNAVGPADESAAMAAAQPITMIATAKASPLRVEKVPVMIAAPFAVRRT